MKYTHTNIYRKRRRRRFFFKVKYRIKSGIVFPLGWECQELSKKIDADFSMRLSIYKNN